MEEAWAGGRESGDHTISTTSAPTTTAKPQRSWLQFSLRTLTVVPSCSNAKPRTASLPEAVLAGAAV
jgi:hypothetical protein